MTNEAAELLRREWGRGSELFDKQLEAALAAERSRLLSQAGVPTDDEITEKLHLEWRFEDFQSKACRGAGREMAEWMREHCASALLQEREKHDKEMEDFAEWMDDKGYYSSEYGHKGVVIAWAHPYRSGKLTTSALLARFRERDS